MNTIGFYKLDGDTLLYAENSVINAEYQLSIIDNDTYTYPIDGWYFFNNEDDAYIFFNLKK